MIRAMDILLSAILIIVFLPGMLLIATAIVLESSGKILFTQWRVGLKGKEFIMLKFRTMFYDSESKGLLTVGTDPRITRVGTFLRKYKLDELPQLLNVLRGEMSMVGPRPEVRKYVELYSTDQRRVLSIRPGLTDFASLKFYNESELLGQSSDPERTYVEEIMPEKIRMNMRFIDNYNTGTYLKILVQTLLRGLGKAPGQ